MSSPDFYERLPILTDFTSVTDPNHYHSIPDDWWIVVADVRRSTQAIEQGLYKAVNILGASVIIGVLNLAKPTAVPFVFGGDGAAVCLPPIWQRPFLTPSAPSAVWPTKCTGWTCA